MRQKNKLLILLSIITSVLLLGGLTVPRQASAQSAVTQYGPNPIVFDQTSTTDNIQYLIAAAAEHTSDLTLYNNDFPKHWWFTNFGATSTDYLKWYISVPTGANYHVLAVIQDNAGQGYRLTESSGAALNFSMNDGNWDHHDVGVIALPAGNSNLTLVRTSTGGAQISSLELIRDSDYTAYNSRVAAARANTTWFSKAGYGLMFQEGAWSYPRSGGKRDINTQANGFDVNAFVNMVKSTGASYVIWSISWYTYQAYAPLSSWSSVFGSSNPYGEANTSTRDLLGDLTSALHANGIRFMLYYHRGEPASALPWFASNVWDPNFSPRGAVSNPPNRDTFFNDWKNVVTEVGNRYGTNLDGWFFDDGMVYYPAKFESLEQAARSGNSSRLIAWNPWIGPRVTDFQDVWMGENNTSGGFPGTSTNGTGIFTAGPNKGELEHGMFAMGSDWGVHNQNQTTGSPSFSAQTAANWVCSAHAAGWPLSFDMMMWDGGTQPDVDSSELSLLQSVKGIVATQCGIGPMPTATPTSSGNLTNDTATGIAYTGSWSYSSGRGYGDYQDDVHYTTTNNDSASFTFTGTGVDFLSEKNSDEGNVEVFIDNVDKGSFNANAATRSVQQVIYSITGLTSGSHTIKVVKTSGTYMLVDAFNVHTSGATPTPTIQPPTNTPPGSTMINNNNAGITYTGTWAYAGNRGAGDYMNDVQYTSTNGDYFQYTFTGTGVDFIAPKGSGYATATVYIDGVNKGNFSEDNGGAYAPQQVIYSITGLASGSHTIKVVKVSGSYHQLDAFKIYS